MRITPLLSAAVAAALAGASGAMAPSGRTRRSVGEGADRAARRHEQRRAEVKAYSRPTSESVDSRQTRRRRALKAAKRGSARGEWRQSPIWLALRASPAAEGDDAARPAPPPHGRAASPRQRRVA